MDTIPGDEAMQNPPHPPLAGLDPAALLKQGVAGDTLLEESSAFHPPSIEELTPLFPQFEFLELIGQGGMGAVYKVRQKELDRVVALKVLPPAIGGTAGFSERFAREAKALARLNHPGIVTIHEFGKTASTDQPLYFILMEFVDGVNLAQLMKAGRIAPREALAIVPQICDALQSAHDQGIVHRDIKPENILLDRLGRVKVADFGIAKVVGNAVSVDGGPRGEYAGENPPQPDATLGGKIIGTPQYMAPEQIDSPAEVDHRADIYALGVVFYQMLTGELPGKNLQAPSRKVGIDVRLDEMVLRALDHNPERRYQTAQEFRTVVDGMHAVAPPPPQRKRGMFRRWWWVFLVMLVIGPVLGLGAGSIFAHFVTKKYESEVVVELKPRDGQGMSSSRFGTEFEKIKSNASLTEVAKQLGLSKKWGVGGEREVVSILKGIVQTENIRGTDLIVIRVRNTDNEEAANIARAVALTYKRNSNDELVIHEGPTVPESPVSPNIPLLLVVGGAGGLLLSPLMALLLIPLLQRMFPERPKEGAARGGIPVWVIITLLLAVTAVGLAVGGAALGYVTLGNVTTSSPAGVTGGMTYEDEEREKVAELLANQYLDLVLDLAVTESSNPGEFQPDRVARRNKLNRFNAAYPDMPDMPDARCIELAGERLGNLEERMAELKRKGLDEKHPDHARLKVRADALREVISGKDRLSEDEARKAETLQSRTNTGESSRRLRWLVEMNPPLAPEGEVSRETPSLPLKTEAVGWAMPDGRFNPVMYLAEPARLNAQGSGRGETKGNGNRRFSLYRGVNPVAADNRFLGSYEIQAEPDTDNVNMGFSLSENGVLYFEAWTDLEEVKLTGWQARPGDDSPGMQLPVAAPSLQERLVDLEVSFITLRKMYNPDQQDVRKAAMAVDDFIRENPTAREGDYVEVLKRRRKTVLVRMEEATIRYKDRHPASVAIRNELEAIEQLARITRHLVIRKPRTSVTGEVKYRFDCSGDTMDTMVYLIRKKYGIRFSFEAIQEKEHGSDPIYYSDLIMELEMKESAGRITDREKERLAELGKFQMPENVGTVETRYYGEIIASSDQDLLEQLTQDTPYQCRPCVDGKRWMISPREGSLLDYPVTLDTQGLTVEQAAERIAAQSPEGKVRLDDNVPKEPESRPWCHVACEPRTFENQPAWEVLCEIGARGKADAVYDLISGLVIQPGERNALAKQPVEDDEGFAASNQYLDLISEMAELEASGLGKSHPDQVVLRKKFDRFIQRYPRMPDERCRQLASHRLSDLDEEMMVLKDRGLGDKHPSLARLRSRAEALKGIAGKKDPVMVTTALFLLSDGRITMDGTEVSRESLTEILKTLRGKSEVKVSIGTGEGVAYEKVTEIIDLCQKCGIWNVSFERQDGKQQPDEVADWLGKMDAGEYAACYAVSAEMVRKAVSEEKWKEAMVMFRTPMGGVFSRRMLKSEVVKQLPGMPVGEHRVMQFETEFANKKTAVETVIFTKENDGAWKSSGYFIR